MTIYGVDFNAKYHTKSGLGTGIAYNYLHASANSITSQFSQPRPHSMTWHLDYEKLFAKDYRLSSSISGRYLSRPHSKGETSNAYSIWRFSLALQMKKAYRITTIVDNLFNYIPKTYYWNSPATKGTSLSIGLSIDVDKI